MGHEQPSIAVVIPMHNAEAYIGRALASVLGQRRPPDEILVVDDASSDNSPAVVAALGDPRVRLLANDSGNRGGSPARNVGIRAANSDWIALLDADDEWKPDYLEVIAGLIDRGGQSIGVAFTAYEIHDGVAARPSALARWTADHGADIRLDTSAFAYLWIRLGGPPMCADTIVIRRQLILEIGGFPTSGCRGPDGSTWISILARAAALGRPVIGATYHLTQGWLARRDEARAKRPCSLDVLLGLMTGPGGTTTEALGRLYNLESWKYVLGRAGRAPIPASAYARFNWRADPVKYIEIRLLAFLPVGVVRAAEPLRRLYSRLRRG